MTVRPALEAVRFVDLSNIFVESNTSARQRLEMQLNYPA